MSTFWIVQWSWGDEWMTEIECPDCLAPKEFGSPGRAREYILATQRESCAYRIVKIEQKRTIL